ncbi:MAG: hypothetical protein ACRYE7_02255 [Janthinobacterium lividum]
MEDAFRICGADISKYLNARDRIFMHVVGLFDAHATILPLSRVSVTEQNWFYDGAFSLMDDAKKRRNLLRRCHELNYDMDYESFMMTILTRNDFSTFEYVHDLKNIKYNIETLRIVSRFDNVKWLKHVMSGINNNFNALKRNNENFIEIGGDTSATRHRDSSHCLRRFDTSSTTTEIVDAERLDRTITKTNTTTVTDENEAEAKEAYNDNRESLTVFKKLRDRVKSNNNNSNNNGVDFKDGRFTEIVEFCARSCYFDCTMLLLQDYGCMLNDSVVSSFIQHGHTKGYSYLLKRNYAFSDVDIMNCITYNRFEWFVAHVKRHNGVLGLFANEYIDNCIVSDRLNILKYIVSILRPYGKKTLTSAYRVELAAMHSVQCLKYLYKLSYRRWISKHVTVQAMRTGNLQCLKFAHENNCEWHVDTMKNAARYGHLKCMKYAYKHNCPWGQDVATMAITFGNYDCLHYAIKHGCPYDFEKIKNVLLLHNREI